MQKTHEKNAKNARKTMHEGRNNEIKPERGRNNVIKQPARGRNNEKMQGLGHQLIHIY